ncbi:subtype B tannase [Volucribacter amazonae]|uniref:Alpha/beta hydrolase n=1 Tax=Volucribacter amazonae TaxID=256731 RepID=A0A9X4PCL0_9PAST|nr:subtype B tannase [Volucribacter amazonae]MDG6895096.1 alpha/beta hydrolase [Volucribacter amazonae]
MCSKKWAKVLSLATCLTSTAVFASQDLIFDPQQYKSQTITVNGKSMAIRAYENIVYVSNPVDTNYQIMNIYIPEAYFEGKSIGQYNAENAPIFLPNQVGGYMPAKPATATSEAQGFAGQAAKTVAAALEQGLIVASPGARGRTTQNTQGEYTGKAPAVIVDLKAAVRYLHFNDSIMPGDANKIISNGTSAGGAVSALLGATGDNQDYEPYLQALGAANASDRIFAVSAYCPITNLEHADMAYEWQFNGINDYKKIDVSMLDYNVQRKEVLGTLDNQQIQVSAQLKQQFPAYLNSLALTDEQGNLLSLDKQGQGSFQQYVKSYVLRSAQTALSQGKDLSQFSWLQIEKGKVTDLDFNAYLHYMGRMKTPPAFDALDLSSGENQLFGTASIDKRHFTPYSQQHSLIADSQQADQDVVKLMNPLNYLNNTQTNAQFWRIRHGTKDSDTSLAIPVILATSLQNQGYQVDFALAWDRPHSGDYDLEELFAWIKQISQ